MISSVPGMAITGRLGRIFGAVIGALAVLTPASPAGAFCRTTTCIDNCPRDELDCKTTGHPLFWPTRCVSFSIQKDGTENIPMKDVRPAILRAFETWADLPCEGGTATMRFQQKVDAACHQAEFNEDAGNANVVMFQDYKWKYTDISNTLAKTTVTYDDATGKILDADLEINHAFNNFTVSDDAVVTDLESVVAHEVGHFLGLDHSHLFDALMTSTYAPGTIMRAVHQDDIDAICTAYPPDRGAPCDDDPIGGFVGECGGVEPEPEGEGCAVGGPGREGELGWGWVLLAGAWPLARLRRSGRRPSIHPVERRRSI